MVTRVRIEVEDSSIGQVERTLQLAHEALHYIGPCEARRLMFGGGDEALVDAQAGEFVVERFANEETGATVYRGRMTAHYAPPAKVVKLRDRADVVPTAKCAG